MWKGNGGKRMVNRGTQQREAGENLVRKIKKIPEILWGKKKQAGCKATESTQLVLPAGS